jgi:hypothetical protein
MTVHILLPGTGTDLYAEARRLLAEGASPDDTVEFNGRKLNGTLAEIADTFADVTPNGHVDNPHGRGGLAIGQI